MYDVFLGGVSCGTSAKWYERFQEELSDDITVYNGVCEGDSNGDTAQEKNNNQVKELCQLDHCKLAVFYFDDTSSTKANSLMQLGNATGQGKPILVGIEKSDKLNAEIEMIRAFCQGCGIAIVDDLESLIWSTEEYLAELQLCEEYVRYNSPNGKEKRVNNGRGSSGYLRQGSRVHDDACCLSGVSKGRSGRPTAARACLYD